MIRAVVDTNVLVSALIGKGPSNKIFKAFRENRFILVISGELLAELVEVLERPIFGLSVSERNELVGLLGRKAEIVNSTQRIDDCRDPKDNIVLECAVAGDARHIVTGDKDLLCLHPYHGISITKPAEFSQILATTG